MIKAYFDAKYRQTDKNHWKALRDDPEYRIMRQFDNGVVNDALEWVGEIDDKTVLRDCWKMFRLNVKNYTADGRLAPDPVEDGKWFAFETPATNAYEAFLDRWTDSHFEADGSGKFVEVGNTLAPPDPNVPLTDLASIKGMNLDIGVW
jgi:hypothetical protein